MNILQNFLKQKEEEKQKSLSPITDPFKSDKIETIIDTEEKRQ